LIEKKKRRNFLDKHLKFIKSAAVKSA
jgi:hypothetical protein